FDPSCWAAVGPVSPSTRAALAKRDEREKRFTRDSFPDIDASVRPAASRIRGAYRLPAAIRPVQRALGTMSRQISRLCLTDTRHFSISARKFLPSRPRLVDWGLDPRSRHSIDRNTKWHGAVNSPAKA